MPFYQAVNDIGVEKYAARNLFKGIAVTVRVVLLLTTIEHEFAHHSAASIPALRFRPAGRPARQRVGWVERSETHRCRQGGMMGLAPLNPSYGLRATCLATMVVGPQADQRRHNGRDTTRPIQPGRLQRKQLVHSSQSVSRRLLSHQTLLDDI